MNHLDEGTIHAWLDGALDAEQSRAAESHVQGCRQCAEAVAEARGLMAASTRILGALDDVPAKVIPAVPATQRRPMWRAAPWVTGIAAVLVAAVVLRTSNSPKSAELMAPVAAITDTARKLAATGNADAATSSAASPATPTAPTAQVAQAPDARPTSTAARGTVSGRVGGGASAGAGAAAPKTAAATATTGSGTQIGEASRKAVAADEDMARLRARREEAAERLSANAAQEVAAAPAPAPPPAAGIAPQRSALLDMAAVRPIDPLRDTLSASARIAGCYVMVVATRGSSVAQELTRRGAADARRQAAVSAAAPAPEGSLTRMIVRLDSVLERQGYRVRDARTDTSIGWWSRAQADSARVEIQMLSVTTMLAGRDRITCPER